MKMEAKRDTSGIDVSGYTLDALPMRSRQFIVLGVTMLLAILDGYDALAMALVAPAVTREWHLGKGFLGIILSSSLMGMAIGSIFLSPIADRLGRRPLLLGGLAAMTFGSMMAGVASGPQMLAAGRFVTGLGIGAVVPLTALFAAEFANRRVRPIAVAAIATIGFPVGGILGGVLASAALPALGWHWIFLLGAIGGAVLVIPVLLFLPESPAYLLTCGAPDALPRINHVLARLGHRPLAAVPAAPVEAVRQPYRVLFSAGAAATTARLIAINLLMATTTFYIINWLPQQISDLGFSLTVASSVSAVSHATGMLGGVVIGLLAIRFAATRLAGLMMIGCTVALLILGHAPPVLAVLMTAACIYGFCGVASTGLFYGILTSSFAPLQRASGIGLVIGVGRAASAVAPAMAGWMFAEGFSRSTVSMIFACGPLIAALLVWRIPVASGNTEEAR
ncbi:MFS transporter [Sphingomonas sp. QA11]|uniref:MFS transporter n=1 Tax=Sphingomonas sp. QA11 TaxID=2950605 RepID=UPI0023497590|nr:MFS transporter [Sphingomonas sp. QA11]WCM25010.1 MFS transporter [Sphingomonas sp. QA11]